MKKTNLSRDDLLVLMQLSAIASGDIEANTLQSNKMRGKLRAYLEKHHKNESSLLLLAPETIQKKRWPFLKRLRKWEAEASAVFAVITLALLAYWLFAQ